MTTTPPAADTAPPATGTPESPGPATDPRRRLTVLDLVLKPNLVSVALPLVILAVALAIIRPGFYSGYTIHSLLVQAGIFTAVGLAQLAVIAVGHMNLALPAMSACSGMVAGFVMIQLGMPAPVAIGLALLAGLALGALQGAIIAFGGLNPFIVTLGLGSLYLGALLSIARGASFTSFPESFAAIGSARIGSVPAIALIAIAVAALAAFIYTRTVSGREMLAVGASFRAARFSAIKVPWTVVKCHALSGLFAGAAALLAIADLGSVDPSLGASWLLPSFAAPVLGGALLTGGKVSSVGTALGAMLLVLVGTGLVVFGVNQYWYQVGLGVVLLLSVLIGQARSRYTMNRSIQ
jgi:ribose transport system permease protein